VIDSVNVPIDCDFPDSLWVTNLTFNSSTLNWTLVPGALSYRIRIRIVNTTGWTFININSGLINSKNLNVLPPNREIEWQIRGICDTNQLVISPWAPLDTFVTTCPAPQNSFTSNIGSSSARLNWDAVPGAIGYLIRGGKVGNPLNLYIEPASTTFKNAFGLLPNTTYQWKVKAICDTIAQGSSAFTQLLQFTTTNFSAKSGEQENGVSFGSSQREKLEVEIYPNPNEGKFRVELNKLNKDEEVVLRVIDVTGTEIVRKEVKETLMGSHKSHFDLIGIAKGIYTIQVVSEDGTIERRIVIQ